MGLAAATGGGGLAVAPTSRPFPGNADRLRPPHHDVVGVSSKILYTGEGINSSIAISQWNDGAVQFHVSGKVEASTEPYDMRLQRMLGHLPALVHPRPAIGADRGLRRGRHGRNVRAVSQHQAHRDLRDGAADSAHRHRILRQGELQRDARSAHADLSTTTRATSCSPRSEKFDIITSDPIHPWVKGSATLYSKEYFELVKEHLNPGGVVTQWVPLYESDTDDGEERDRDLLRRLPERHHLGQRATTAAATTRCCWARWNRRRSTWTPSRQRLTQPGLRRAWRNRCATSVSARCWTCWPLTPARTRI